MARKPRKTKAHPLPETFLPSTAEDPTTDVPRREFEHVVRHSSDYVEYTRCGGPLGGGVIATATVPITPPERDENLIRVYARSQGAAEGPFVDRDMYTDYLTKGRYF